MAENKFFNRFKKNVKTSDPGEAYQPLINPIVLKEEIAKAIRFIKVKQFHSGFTEIFSPEQGGNIEVTIKQDARNNDVFHINFRFVTIPGHITLLSQEKRINYDELKRLAKEYDNHREQIDAALAYREELVSIFSRKI